MSAVLFSCDAYAIIDERSFYNDTYKELGLTLDERLFLINGPFMMDSQFQASKREGRRIRKRKKPTFAPTAMTEEIAATEKISKIIQETGKRLGYFCPQMTRDNNLEAREAAREVAKHAVKFYRPMAISSPEVIILKDKSTFIVDREYCMLNFWYRNESDTIVTLEVSESDCEPSTSHYIPPHSTFHIGPVTDLRNFVSLNGEEFDLIVVDPPWENLSVKRQRSYFTSDSALCSLDMESLSLNGLVAIWITNRKGISKDLAAHLQRWGLTRLAELIWLKVTKEGDPVCPFNSAHKLPYEKLVLASRREAVSTYTSISSSSGKIFASVPMALPSRKPPVLLMLEEFGVRPVRCLELFARCLQPNTVSVGFETLLLQSRSCFSPAHIPETAKDLG